tara:strand:- start:760 stop:1095 length:336 start_codon:yes stop_codon:yes gene_type:complete
MSLQLEKLEDLLTIDENKLKSPDKTAVIRKIKQLLKAEGKSEVLADDESEDFPYEAISIVGSTYVTVKFDIDSKKARVIETHEHSTDSRGKNYMVGAEAIKRLQKLIKEQK